MSETADIIFMSCRVVLSLTDPSKRKRNRSTALHKVNLFLLHFRCFSNAFPRNKEVGIFWCSAVVECDFNGRGHQVSTGSALLKGASYGIGLSKVNNSLPIYHLASKANSVL